MNNKSTITFPLTTNLNAGPVIALTQSTATDIDLSYIENLPAELADVGEFYNNGGVSPTLALEPKNKAYGMHLAYHQSIGNTGFFLDLNLPFVSVENDVQFKFFGTQTTVAAFGGGAPFNIKQNLTENFAGVPLTVSGPDLRANTFHTAA